jgi:hypothetical protein
MQQRVWRVSGLMQTTAENRLVDAIMIMDKRAIFLD